VPPPPLHQDAVYDSKSNRSVRRRLAVPGPYPRATGTHFAAPRRGTAFALLWCPRRYIALGPGPNGDTGFVTYNASSGAIVAFQELKAPFSKGPPGGWLGLVGRQAML
jgi:hypothetical protein